MAFFFSVFKATPTLWQPMAEATLDSLLATAISSQVSGLDTLGFGNSGNRMHLGEAERTLKENSVYTPSFKR